MRILLLALSVGTALAAPIRVRETGFQPGPDGRPAGWSVWSARAETAPRCFVDTLHYRTGPGSLAISGASNIAEHGGWERTVPGIEAGSWYRMTAYYRTEAVEHDSLQVVARLDWRDAKKQRAGQPDYVYKARREGAWTRVTLDAPAPERAAAVTLQLYLSNAPQGTVWWDDISLEQIPAPAPRRIKVASINLKPGGTKSAAESVAQFLKATEATVQGKTDVILYPEGITVVGTGKSYAEVAESIPGPTTATLGEVARKHSSYVAAGIYEREGPAVYNTAVLLNRAGEVVGKYRKVYLPREEIERGLTPGFDYPVFQTDFGTVGLMICYDVFFSDPARNLASKGAEVILMPIWGGDQTLGKARAIENRVFLAASGYDYPTYVMDPDGEILSSAPQRGAAAIATIDLNKRYAHPHLGDMRNRRAKELRVDVKPAVPGFEN
ncbi:MAG TPA: carbon-nitrogen hydrolase family protein [Bryobacteraceae bacterium]|jgi:predicted amidohydrolase|nr:carbon-nitrogen hydrolase family protein [Bryobacteraceae bacterium]